MQVPNVAYISEVWNEILSTIFPVAHMPTVHLYVNNPTIQPNMLVAAFTEASFPGYVPSAFSGFGPATIVANQNVIAYDTAVESWTATGTSTGQTVNGYWIQDNAGFVVAAEKFATPVPMTALGNTIQLVCGVGIGASPAAVVIIP